MKNSSPSMSRRHCRPTNTNPARLKQEQFDLSDKSALEVALGDVAGQSQGLEAVRVLDQLLHQLVVVGR